MKRFIVVTMLVAAFGLCNLVQAQFKNAKTAWGLSAGGAHGTNATKDEWVMQYRGFFQYEIIPQKLVGQLGLGYVGLKASGVYSAYTGLLDLRALYTPFSLTNLNPYLYGGFGIAKVFKNASTLLPMMPFGIGAQTNIAKGVLLDINGGYNLVFSDKLDGFARSNNNLNALTNARNDAFYGFTIGLAFSLGRNDDELAIKKAELDQSEARRVKELAAAEAVRSKQQSDAEALRMKQQADADAAAKLAKADADAAAKLAKEDSDAAAKLAKAAAEADARLLAQQKGRDTVIVFVKGKSVVIRGINFEFNKATLMKNSEIILWRAYNALVANPKVQVIIIGHTDNIGSQEFNQKLSLERAQTVRNWLVENGIASNRMKTEGKGLNEPIATNNTDEGRAQNRRMEFFVVQQ